MTTINDISDLIRIIQHDPAWAEALRSVLLSKELLELPETFAAFVGETRENFRLVYQRLDNIESDVADLKSSVNRMSGDINRMGGDINRMGGDISRLTGRDYETRAARRAPLMAAHALNLSHAETFFSAAHPDQLDSLALDAQLKGVINPAEALELQSADLIITGHGPNYPELRLLGEISVTIQQKDLDRATRRSQILQKATGITTLPILIGTAVEPELDIGKITFLEVPDIT